MSHIKSVENKLQDWENWVSRRSKGIPNNKQLFVLACMDERVPVEEVLDLDLGDAHVFRNAGGLATDDAIRSAALTIHFHQTREIIIVNHTECGMLSATGAQVTQAIEERTGLDLSEVALDPGLPNFRLSEEDVHAWWKMQTNIDETALAQAEAFRSHPLIPDSTSISSFVYELEAGHLRRPKEIFAQRTVTPPAREVTNFGD
jgi:carbonic anhydrase